MTVTGRSRSRISRIRSRPLIPGRQQVGQNQREVALDEPLQGGRAVVGDLDLPVRECEELRELLADELAVVHHKDASIHGALIQG